MIAFWLVSAVFALASCGPRHIVISSGDYYRRTGTWTRQEWEKAPYRYWVELWGASGRSFADRTEKRILLLVEKQGGGKFNGEYRVTTAWLTMDSEWSDSGKSLTLRFYDLPDGTTLASKGWKEMRRLVLTLKFVYDEKADGFVEVAY